MPIWRIAAIGFVKMSCFLMSLSKIFLVTLKNFNILITSLSPGHVPMVVHICLVHYPAWLSIHYCIFHQQYSVHNKAKACGKRSFKSLRSEFFSRQILLIFPHNQSSCDTSSNLVAHYCSIVFLRPTFRTKKCWFLDSKISTINCDLDMRKVIAKMLNF